MNETLSPLLKEKEVAALLGVAPSTLARLAREGKSPVTPVYITDFSRRYRASDLEKFLNQANGSETSSSL